MFEGDRLESRALHVRADLAWNFLEDLFGQITSGLSLVELNELDDITSNSLSTRVFQGTIIAIELLHRREVRVANTNNDDRARKLG